MSAQVQAAIANRSRFGYGMDTVPLSQLFTQRMWYPQHTTIPAQQAGQPVPSPAPAPPPAPVSDKLKIKMILGRVINPGSDVPTEEERAEFVASTKNVFADHVGASAADAAADAEGAFKEIDNLFATEGEKAPSPPKEGTVDVSSNPFLENPGFEGELVSAYEFLGSAEGGAPNPGEVSESAEDGGPEEEESPAPAEADPPKSAEGGGREEGEVSESIVETTKSQREVTAFRDDTLSGSDFESSVILCLIFPSYIDANRAEFPAEKQALIISSWWRDDFPYIILIELCKNLITGQSAIEEILQIFEDEGESAVNDRYSISDDQANRLDSIFGDADDDDDDGSDGESNSGDADDDDDDGSDDESNSDGDEEGETTAVVDNGGSPGPAPAKSPGKKTKKKQEEGVNVEESSYSPFRSDATQEYDAWLKELPKEKQISLGVIFFDNANEENAGKIRDSLDADADRILTTPSKDKESLIRVLMSLLSGKAKTLGKKSNKVFDDLLAKEFPPLPGHKPDTNWTGGKNNDSGRKAVLRYLRRVRPITVEMIAGFATLPKNKLFGTDVGKVSKDMISPFLADGESEEFSTAYNALREANSVEDDSGDVGNTASEDEDAPAEDEDAPTEDEGAPAEGEDAALAEREDGKGTAPSEGEYESAGNV